MKVETAADYNARQQVFVKAMEKDRAMNQKYLDDNKAKAGVTTLPSGLQYEVLTAGTGKHPKPTDTVRVHYKGTLIDGTEFDSSYSRGAPAEFQVNRLIKGWQEALPLMQEGAKWRLTIPANLAYGDHGAGAIIKPGSTLVFEMELIKVL
ncbi:FKBP-type peptidyl-prolyl cis-trans isomerase [Govanella unica]|uniref:FKBP-type peptidyl-prolyl cis-trans isomerase n=1 Tax=Govanella unica TaxID=2975056 RepID=UPI0023A7C2EA|nr:FKBP-type peptidyl-prolyl cis-trans isomerase [Govania unica]